MPIQMTALRSFEGLPAEGAGGRVKRNSQFEASDDKRATLLETKGLAKRVTVPAAQAKNEAQRKGPLRSRGGKTGGKKKPR